MNKNYHQNILFVIIIISSTVLAVIIIQAGPPIGTTVNNVKAAGAVVAEQQPFKFTTTECIEDVSGIFLQGYYDAHSGFFVGLHNETIGAPPQGLVIVILLLCGSLKNVENKAYAVSELCRVFENLPKEAWRKRR